MYIPPHLLNLVATLNPMKVAGLMPKAVGSIHRAVKAVAPPEQSEQEEIEERRLAKPRINPLARFKHRRPLRDGNKDRGQNLDVEI